MYMYTYKLSKKTKAKERNYHSHRCAPARLLYFSMCLIWPMAMSKKLVPQGSHFCMCSRPPDPLDRMITVLQNNGVFVNYIPRQTHWVCTRIVTKMRNFAKVHPIWRNSPKMFLRASCFSIKPFETLLLSSNFHCFCKIFVGYFVTILIFAPK